MENENTSPHCVDEENAAVVVNSESNSDQEAYEAIQESMKGVMKGCTGVVGGKCGIVQSEDILEIPNHCTELYTGEWKTFLELEVE